MLWTLGKLRRGGTCFIYLYSYFCSIPIPTVVLKDFIKSMCLFAPTVACIQGCHGESVPTCWSAEKGALASVQLLWGPALLLGTCRGCDWCYEGVGGNSFLSAPGTHAKRKRRSWLSTCSGHGSLPRLWWQCMFTSAAASSSVVLAPL